MNTLEHAFTCPYCWETITMVIEPLAVPQEAVQEYVEDCEVCCNPIVVRFSIESAESDEPADGSATMASSRGLQFSASRLEQ